MIHDYMKTEKMNGVRIPDLKGHVKIALKDTRTGKTDIVFEGDNIITDAVKDIFASNLCGGMDYRSMLPLYSKMFGGILCFKELLNVDSPTVADAKKDYYIPDSNTNELTAHAGQTRFTSQADDVKRGDPLNTSVVVADGSVTLAWEWGSAAGNGKIKSVALTHADVGDAGLGSTSDAFKAMTPNINPSFGMVPSKPVAFIDKNGYGYTFYTSGTTLSITKFPMDYKEVGLIGMPYDYIEGKEKTKNFTLGTSHSKNPYFAFDKENDILYLFYNTSQSTTVYVDIVNLSNWASASITSTTWTIDTAVGPLCDTHSNNNQSVPLPICRGYVYLPVNNQDFDVIKATEFVKVQISNTGNQSEISGNATRCTGVFSPNADGRIIAGKCFVINNGVLYPTAIGTPDVIMHSSGISVLENTILDQGEGLVQMARRKTEYSSGYLYYPSVSKFYLASKFNLPEEVTKSNVQSMVITYTLTEV